MMYLQITISAYFTDTWKLTEILNTNRRIFQHMRNISHMYVCKIKEGIIKGVGGPCKNVQNHPRVLVFHINSIGSPISAKKNTLNVSLY